MISSHEVARRRTFKRAAHAWSRGMPHRAWEILAVAGYGDLWPAFQREALRQARRRYRARMG
jgi:hypothetical protein